MCTVHHYLHYHMFTDVYLRVIAQLRRFHAGASTMEEGKLFLSVTVLYCHDYLNFLSRKRFFSLIDLK